MKIFYFLIPVMLMGGCKTNTATVSQSQQTDMELKSGGECPTEGKCTVTVHKNKSLTIQEDGTGALYPVVEEGENLVIEFNYLREAPAGIADGNYSETIHFEIPSNVKSLKKEDGALADVKLLFGRHCFCPDAGYYRVENGKLTVMNQGGKIQFDLQYQMNNVSQIISHITQSVTID